jgi:hypothetical protein
MVEVLHFLGHVEAQDDLVSHQDLIFDVTNPPVTSALQYVRPYIACIKILQGVGLGGLMSHMYHKAIRRQRRRRPEGRHRGKVACVDGTEACVLVESSGASVCVGRRGLAI